MPSSSVDSDQTPNTLSDEGLGIVFLNGLNFLELFKNCGSDHCKTYIIILWTITGLRQFTTYSTLYVEIALCLLFSIS